ncbi:addiction module protein [bacterium]|nr:addiction module protein [bacterium]
MSFSTKVERILQEVQTLSDDEREELFRALDATGEIKLSAEWREEIQSRARDIDEGRVALIAHAEVLRRLREGTEAYKRTCG